MVSPCVPGQLRDETVVLVPVVVVVGQDEVRREARFEVLEGFLDAARPGTERIRRETRE